MAQQQTTLETAGPDWDEGEPEHVIPDPYEGFHIDTDDKADWYLGKICALIDEKKRLTDAHLARLRKFAVEITGLMRRFDGEFEHYMAGRIAGSGGATVILDHGSVSLRGVGRSIAVADPLAAQSYCENSGLDDLLIKKTDLDKTAYGKLAKKSLDGDGELLPGIKVTPPHKSFNYDGREEGLRLLAKEDASG